MKISVSGIRGIYGTDLTLHEISTSTKKFATFIRKGDSACVLAYDTRPSSRLISQFVAGNLMEMGVDVYNLGIAPTPMAFREAQKYGAGVVITASHNPLEWNGLKFVIGGRGIVEEELNYILKSHVKLNTGKFGRFLDLHSDYVDQVVRMIVPQLGRSNPRLGLDPGGGAACLYSYQLFEQLGYSFLSINDISGLSSRSPDPTTDDLTQLRTLVSTNSLDLGFAFDLDGDRLVVINSKGEKLNPDSTLLLCIANSISMGMKKFVSSVDTSLSVEKYIRASGASLLYSKVGEANVVKKMLDVEADAGGEGSSAGFIIPKFNMCRDGFLASSIISSTPHNVIEECLRLSSEYHQIRSAIPVKSHLHIKLIDKLSDVLNGEATEILTVDGVKAILDDDSWVLVRPSNTEHAIRISVESTPSRAQLLFNKTEERVLEEYDQLK